MLKLLPALASITLGASAAFALGPAHRIAPVQAKLPAGFSYTVYAEDLRDVRMLRFGPDGALYASLTGPGEIVRLSGVSAGGKAVARKTLLSGLNLPHGLAFRGKDLYVADTGEIRVFAGAKPPGKRIASLPDGGMHFTRTIGFSPDGWLYVSVGSDCNVCEESDPRRAAISRMHADGSRFELYARGLRNAVGFDWGSDGHLFATNNGRDLLGDDEPPEIIADVKKGDDYGWPYATSAGHPDPSYPGHDISGVTHPAALLPAHTAPLGIAVSTGKKFPARYRGGLFVCEHGSWDRSTPVGYQVVYLP